MSLKTLGKLGDIAKGLKNITNPESLSDDIYEILKNSIKGKSADDAIDLFSKIKLNPKLSKDLIKASADAGELASSAEEVGKSLAGIEKNSANVGTLSDAFKGLGSIIKAHPIAAAGIGITAVVTAGVVAYKKYKENMIKDATEGTKEWNESLSSIQENITKYTELKKQLNSGDLSETETLSIKQQILDIQNQIISSYGGEASGIDLINGKLETQVDLMRSISKEEAQKNINEHRKGYEDAENEIRKTREYDLGSLLPDEYSKKNKKYQEAKDEILKLVDEFESKGIQKISDSRLGEGNYQIKFTGDASQANLVINEFESRVEQLKEKYGEDNVAIDSILTNSSSALVANNNVLDKYQESYNAFLSEKAYSKGYGKQISEYAQSVKDYNDALLSGDSTKIKEAASAFEKADKAKKILLSENGNDKFSPIFDGIAEQLDETAVKYNDFKEALSDDPVRDNNQFKDKSDSLKKFSNNLKGAKLDVVDVQNALETEGAQKLEYSIRQIADAWGLTSDSSTEEIKAFADTLENLGIVGTQTGESLEDASTSFSTFTNNVSNSMGLIDTINAALVGSVSGKGIAFGFQEDANTGIVSLTGDVVQLQDAYMNLKDASGEPLFKNTKELSDTLFEKTANGIHLNMEALRELQKVEESNQKADFIDKRIELQNKLNEAIANQPTDKNSAEWSASQANIESLQSQLETIDLLASAYDGATSAYQKWIDAQSGGEEGDMYDNIRDTAIKRGDELYKAGLVGTEEFRAIADLFSYEDLSTAPVDQVVAAYKKASPPIKKFFTEGKEGIDDFVTNMKKISDKENLGWVETLEDGTLKFNTGNDDAVAKAFGVDPEIIQAIYRKMKDYGASVEIGDTSGVDNYSDKLKTLQKQAETAKEKLNEMQGTDIKFNFDSQSIENLSSQIDTANQIVQNLPKNEDGTINMKAEGASEAILVLETLIQKREELASNSNIVMRLSVEEGTEVDTLQKFQQAKDELDTKNQLKAQGITVDTSEAEKNVTGLMDEIQKIAKEHPELEIDMTNADTVEESLSKLTKEQLLELGVDTSQLDSAEEKLERIKGLSEFNVTVNVNGKEDVNMLGNELSSLPPESNPSVQVNVQNSDQVESTAQKLENIPQDTSANLIFTVSNAADAEVFTEKVNELNAQRDKDHQITYSMNIVPGNGTSEIESMTQPKEIDVNVKVTGQDQLSSLSSQLSDLNANAHGITIDATVNGSEAVSALKDAISAISSSNVTVSANVSGTSQTNALADAIKRVASKNVQIIAYTSGKDAVSALADAISSVKSKSVTITSTTNKITNNIVNNKTTTGATGTMISPAHTNGTFLSAYASGKVSVSKDQDALVNETGIESRVRNGVWELIPGGPHIESTKKGDIIFNAKQTEDLLRHGYTNQRGMLAHADGTFGNNSLSAFSSGSWNIGKTVGGSGSNKKSGSSNAKKSGSSNNGSTKAINSNTGAVKKNNKVVADNTKSNEKLQDWIEVTVDRLRDSLKHFSDSIDDFEMNYNQNNAIDQYVSKAQNYQGTLRQSANAYMTKANALGLSGSYVHKIWAGEMNIEDIQDENLQDKISKYTEWCKSRPSIWQQVEVFYLIAGTP